MRTSLKMLVITLLFGVAAFVLGPVLWPPSPDIHPSAAQLPYLIVLSVIEALAFGFGVAFIVYGRSLIKGLTGGVGKAASAMHGSLAWLLVSWWPHDNLHMCQCAFGKRHAVDPPIDPEPAESQTEDEGAQHQFEGMVWERHDKWNYVTAALQGSSFYKLPKVLQWFSGNIGFHHIHHLSPRIPNYNLEPCYKSDPLFQAVKPVTLRSSLKSLTLRLWDEQHRRLVGFGGIKQLHEG